MLICLSKTQQGGALKIEIYVSVIEDENVSFFKLTNKEQSTVFLSLQFHSSAGTNTAGPVIRDSILSPAEVLPRQQVNNLVLITQY